MKRFLPELGLFCLLCTPALAQTNQQNDTADEGPSLEMLAFLGEWQDDSGDFVPPDELPGIAGTAEQSRQTGTSAENIPDESTHTRGDEQ
jgi:hypothetical protein